MPDPKQQGDSSRQRGDEIPALSIISLDDDADFSEYIRDLLESDGHDVRTVATPDELYAKVEARQPDVVLLDMKMGRHDGASVLEELRKRWARLCVIIVTGYPSLDTMRNTFKQDIFDYLAKPFSPDELRKILRQAAATFGLGGSPQRRLRAELGRQIRLSRANKDWTLKDLSENSGVSVSQLSSIERGTHLPSLESFVNIAVALGALPSEWLKGSGL